MTCFWFLVSGFWFLVSGFWFLVSGFWFLVSGFWLLAFAINRRNQPPSVGPGEGVAVTGARSG